MYNKMVGARIVLTFISVLVLVGGLYLFLTKLDLSQTSKKNTVSEQMQIVAVRLSPLQDLKLQLDSLVTKNNIEAGCILTCAGSLQKAVIRFANQDEVSVFEEKFEIVSLTGTLSKHGSPINISIADKNGKTIGGYLMEGCKIYTTAEIVIGILPHLKFLRKYDTVSGFYELSIEKKELSILGQTKHE